MLLVVVPLRQTRLMISRRVASLALESLRQLASGPARDVLLLLVPCLVSEMTLSSYSAPLGPGAAYSEDLDVGRKVLVAEA